MFKKPYASVNDQDQARLAMWVRIFGENKVPVQTMLPSPATFDGRGGLAYYVDFDRVTHDQYNRMVDEIAKMFMLSPDYIVEYTLKNGMAIDADCVTVYLADAPFDPSELN